MSRMRSVLDDDSFEAISSRVRDGEQLVGRAAGLRGDLLCFRPGRVRLTRDARREASRNPSSADRMVLTLDQFLLEASLARLTAWRDFEQTV